MDQLQSTLKISKKLDELRELGKDNPVDATLEMIDLFHEHTDNVGVQESAKMMIVESLEMFPGALKSFLLALKPVIEEEREKENKKREAITALEHLHENIDTLPDEVITSRLRQIMEAGGVPRNIALVLNKPLSWVLDHLR